MSTLRDEKVTNAITNEGFEYKGLFYKSLSTRMLLLLEKFKSPFYFGGDPMKGLMDFLYIAQGDQKAIQRMTPSEFEDAVFDFSDDLTPDDLNGLKVLADNMNTESSSTVVEIKEDNSKKKPRKA
jgi:hypothetical protein